MNLGQTMLTVGMFVLLTMSVLSANRMILENTESNLRTEALSGAATVAQDLMAEAMSKKFDASSNSSGKQDTSAFDRPAALGPSSSEAAAVSIPDSSTSSNFRSITAYNDFDDYKGYKRLVTANNISGFVAEATVYYVTSDNLDIPSSRRSYYKVIKVAVSHPLYIATPLVFTSLFSY